MADIVNTFIIIVFLIIVTAFTIIFGGITIYYALKVVKMFTDYFDPIFIGLI